MSHTSTCICIYVGVCTYSMHHEPIVSSSISMHIYIYIHMHTRVYACVLQEYADHIVHAQNICRQICTYISIYTYTHARHEASASLVRSWPLHVAAPASCLCCILPRAALCRHPTLCETCCRLSSGPISNMSPNSRVGPKRG